MRQLLFLFFPLITFSQKNCEGFVLDKITGNKIPYATIGLIKQNKGVSANDEGAFNIYSSFANADSLRISSVGYETQVIPVSVWISGNIVKLQPKTKLLDEIVISNLQKRVYSLNGFKRCSSNWYQIGAETFYQLAQRFEAPEQGMQLTGFELCKDGAESIFRLRIYDVDSTSGSPSKDLIDTIIELRSKEKHVQVNLEKYDIVIPSKKFFVAIEWIFIPFNERLETEKIRGKKTAYIVYRPAIRFVTNRNTKKSNVWLLHFNGSWSEMHDKGKDDNFQISVKLR